jgi:hypothetical protein
MMDLQEVIHVHDPHALGFVHLDGRADAVVGHEHMHALWHAKVQGKKMEPVLCAESGTRGDGVAKGCGGRGVLI